MHTLEQSFITLRRVKAWPRSTLKNRPKKLHKRFMYGYEARQICKNLLYKAEAIDASSFHFISFFNLFSEIRKGCFAITIVYACCNK